MSFITAESQGRNVTAAEVTQFCPPNMVFMRNEFSSVGVPQGKVGGCPADFNVQNNLGSRDYADDICTTSKLDLPDLFDPELDEEDRYVQTLYGKAIPAALDESWTKKTLAFQYGDCHAPQSNLIWSNCRGRNNCTHKVYESDYSMVCPKQNLLDKSLVSYLSCGNNHVSLHSIFSLLVAKSVAFCRYTDHRQACARRCFIWT